MHTHNHSCCDHCLHHCPSCDVVYCCKCKTEWGNTTGYWYYPWITTPIVDPYYGTTCDDVTTFAPTKCIFTAHSHEH